MYYSYFLRYIGRNAPFYSIERALSPVNSPQLNLSRPFNAVAPTELTVSMIDPHLHTNYDHNATLGIDYEFRKQWLFQISYAHCSARFLVPHMPASWKLQ